MGMIIVFLLFYVIYKLWRQREAITNAKLSDAAYTVAGFKNVTRAGGRSVSVSISPTGSGFQTVRCPNPDTCEVLSDTTETMNPCLSDSNEMHGVQERDPLLLGNTIQCRTEAKLNLLKGDLVLVVDSSIHRVHWPEAVVLDFKEGEGGLVKDAVV
ncbi:uncharacterized protein DEA37_0007429 [Paragonimus westermani]|uniref:DUF5641 domain-containing protein n=1 Tax=Paragonimus westermani TaxID=34504 RepID=A0A5J4NUE9_9TREM|nr:uncharacterized protein DEA37_0007429 [Paragonimus westermani]